MKIRKILLFVLVAAMLALFAIGIAGCKRNNGNTSDQSSGNSSVADNSASASAGQSDSSTGDDLIVIAGVNPNTDMMTYKANKAEKTATDKENEFFDRERNMFVGDDNAFCVKPGVAFRIFRGDSAQSEVYVPDSWNYTVNVYVKNGDNYVLLEGQDVTTYIDAVDTAAATVDFSADAVGHEFKIETYPDGLTARQLTDDDYKVAVEVEVIDGYNVYSAKELAYVENGGMYNRGDSANYNAAWAEFKADKGLDAASPAAVIMQTNINVTKDDIPSVYFWSDKEVAPSDADAQKAIGSFKDYNFIYFRKLTGSDSFTFEGNYFTLDCRSLPLIVRPNDDIVSSDATFESHSSLFFFGSQDETASSRKVTMTDVNFIGNSPRVEDTSKSGGVILAKVNSVCFDAYNNISSSFVINYFAESNKLNMTIEKCKCYDSFSTLMYVRGSTDVNIVDSEFIGAGGPVMIVDHVGLTDPDGGTPSCVKVKNSQLHSYITGQEAWFNMHGATSVVSQIVMMNDGFTPFGRSFVKSRTTGDGTLNFIDFVAMYKSGSAEAMTAEKVSGKFEKEGAALPMDFGTYTEPWDNFATNRPASIYIETVLGVNSGLPIFMTSGGGMSFFSPTAIPEMGIGMGLNTFEGSAPKQIMDPADNMFKGDLLYMYYSRMGLVFNYFNAGETI